MFYFKKKTHPIAKKFIVTPFFYIGNQISCDCGIEFYHKYYSDCGIQYLLDQQKFDIYHCWWSNLKELVLISVNHASLVIMFAK